MSFLFALEVVPFPTVFHHGALTIDNSRSSIAGVPVGALATVHEHPYLKALGFICFFLYYGASLLEVLAPRETSQPAPAAQHNLHQLDHPSN